MVVTGPIITPEWYDSFLDRAEREFRRAWDEMLSPNTNDALRSLRRDLARYADALRKEGITSLDSVALLFANFLAYQAPLLYSLRIELIGAPGTAAISEKGDLYVFACPLFDRNYQKNPLRGVLPDSKFEESYFADLLYGFGYDEKLFEERLLKTLSARQIRLVSDESGDSYVGNPDLWPDNEPIFDTAFLAALVIHELAHVGFSHFGHTAKVFTTKVLNMLRHSRSDEVVRWRRMVSRMRRAVKRHVTMANLPLPDEIAKLVKDGYEASVVHQLFNQAADAFIHGVLPLVEVIIAEGMKRRYFPEGGGGGGGGKQIVIGEMVGEGEGDSDESGDADTDRDSSGKEPGRNEFRVKRRTVQRGLSQRDYMMKSTERQDSIFEGLSRVSKSIGTSATDLIERARAAILKLRQDPFVKYNRAQRKVASLFGKPSLRSKNPRPDEVYLRRKGKLSYLPRMTKQPTAKRMMVVVDTSGSVSSDDIAVAFGFIEAVLSKYNYHFTLYVCDTQPHLVCEDARKLPRDIMMPRGGTDLSAAIRDADERGILDRYSAFVFITDGLNEYWGTDIIKRSVRDPAVCVLLTSNETSDNYLREIRESGIEHDVVSLMDIVELRK